MTCKEKQRRARTLERILCGGEPRSSFSSFRTLGRMLVSQVSRSLLRDELRYAPSAYRDYLSFVLPASTGSRL